MKNAIVIGATSGIGRALAKELVRHGYTVGAVGRRTELLYSLQRESKGVSYIKTIDMTAPDAPELLEELISRMGGIDLMVINAGVGFSNEELALGAELRTIAVNVSGFVAAATVAFKYFRQQKRGHIVGLSSVAGVRGMGPAPAYSASKAFVSTYLEGLRQRAIKENIVITDIRPGFVDTDMTKGQKGMFWVISAQKAAKLIFEAIEKKKRYAYIPFQWRFVAWLMKIVPASLYERA